MKFVLGGQGKMRWFRWSAAAVMGCVVTLVYLGVAKADAPEPVTVDSQLDDHQKQQRRLTAEDDHVHIPVYTSSHEDSPIARKQVHDLAQNLAQEGVYFESISLKVDQQRYFLQNHPSCGSAAAKRFDEFLDLEQEHFAAAVFQWCALSTSDAETTIYLESDTPLLMRLQEIVQYAVVAAGGRSMVVLGDENYFPETMHGSFVLLQKKHRFLAHHVLETLVDTHIDSLKVSPLLIPKTFYSLVQSQIKKEENFPRDQSLKLKPGSHNYQYWDILEQSCRMDPLRRNKTPSSWTDTNSHRLTHRCPESNGFCCTVAQNGSQVAFMGRHPVLPVQRLPQDLPQPYNAATGHFEEDELPYIATVREEHFDRPADYGDTPNFYDILLQNNCLPDQEDCSKCLREKKGANCTTCAEPCHCYCQTLCREHAPPKFVARKWYVQPPAYARDPSRLIPRVVHQTWFEELTADRYPNMSRLVESFKQSGWEYKFYSDEAAANFLSTHFPPQVREAYDALKPGAFKADLFRYCALLIHGGVYADVDIQLESTLDYAVPVDVGLMVPVDEVSVVHVCFGCCNRGSHQV